MTIAFDFTTKIHSVHEHCTLHWTVIFTNIYEVSRITLSSNAYEEISLSIDNAEATFKYLNRITYLETRVEWNLS